MIDWNDNAKAAVKEFYRWANAMFKSGCSIDTDTFFKEFTEEQTKTVADAVVENDGKWPLRDEFDTLWYTEKFKAYGCFQTQSEDLVRVCTRAEFEAYVNANKIGKILESRDEQEGEKWTHTYFNVRCSIIDLDPDEFGTVVIVKEEGDYALAHPSKLNPIKPTISEAEAWRMAVLSGNMQHITDNYDVVKD